MYNKKFLNILETFNMQDGKIDYIALAKLSQTMLDEIFGKNNYSIPINIEKIANYLGIEVIEIDLNYSNEPMNFSYIIGELSILPQIFDSGKKKSVIYIDSNTTLYTQRYALAYEIGRYLMNMHKMIFSDECYIMPMLPKDAEELVADAFAIFLLIPIKFFVKEFTDYVNEERKNKRELNSIEDWLQYLSTTAMLSYHYVAFGYQQLQYVTYWRHKYLDTRMERN